jgi:CubicO group peptidase (beta-lactamase class C family)
MLRTLSLWLLLADLVSAQDLNARLEQIIQSHVTNKQFMGTVLIAKGGTVMLDRGYGSANLEWGIFNSPATKFRLGSVTQQFTAACALLLEERGKWKVSDPVKEYMPDAPAAWAIKPSFSKAQRGCTLRWVRISCLYLEPSRAGTSCLTRTRI